jgi:hypothetical protein
MLMSVTAQELDELKRMLAQMRSVVEARRMAEASRQPTAEEVQRDISRTMANVVKDPYCNPQSLRAPATATPANAPRVVTHGWQEERKIESPPGQDAIEALCNSMQPHGAGNPLRKGK